MDRAEDSTPRVLGAYRACRRSRKEEEGSSWSLNVVGGVACVRACVRADTSSLPRGCLGTHCSREGRPGTRTPSRVVRWMETSPRRIAARRGGTFGGVGWSEREGRVHVRALWRARVCSTYVRVHVFLCVLVRVCREDAAARARAPLRARERASERERERLAGSLEADWWPDRALRPTVAASGRRLTESGNARRRRRGAASTRPPWPDSRLWTIDRSVHPPRRRKMYRKWGLDINLARRCFPLRTNL